MPNPWDPPPWPDKGDASYNDLYAAVGEALTAWEYAEDALSFLFARLVGASGAVDAAPAVRAYGTVVSFQARHSLVLAAGEAFFVQHPNPNIEQAFYGILKRCMGWASRRNDVAHGAVGSDDDIPPPNWFLWPGPYNSKKHSLPDKKPKYRYTAGQIKKFGEEFGVLEIKLAHLRKQLGSPY